MIKLNSHLNDEVLALINDKIAKYKLFYALYFKYYEERNAFFTEQPSFSRSLVTTLAEKLGVSTKINVPTQKSLTNYRKEIRDYLNTCTISSEHENLIKAYINELIQTQKLFKLDALKEKVYAYLKENKIEKTSDNALNKIIKSALHQHNQNVFELISGALDFETKAYLDGLMLAKDSSMSRLNYIKRWPQGMSVKSIKIEADKLSFLTMLTLPDCLDEVTEGQLKKHYRNISTKYPSAIKEIPEVTRYALLSIFCFIRQRELIDNLVEMLIKLTHKVFVSGENKLQNELSTVLEIKDNCNRKGILELLIDTIVSQEKKVIENAIYPVISKEKLLAIKSKNKNNTITYNSLVYDKVRASYARHYRQMLAPVIKLLTFRSNNKSYQPVIEALSVIKQHLSDNSTYYPAEENIPINGAVKRSHEKCVIEETSQGDCIKRIDYELCVLHNLRNKLRVKEIWVEGAYLYRDPEKDLPQDFEEEKEAYHEILDKPIDAKQFVTKLKKSLTKHLNEFNLNLPKNKLVSILKRPKGHIKLTPLKEQPEPPQLEAIKQEVFKRWPSTSLLDVLKEADVFVDFIKDFVPSGSKEGLDKETIKNVYYLQYLLMVLTPA